MLLKKVGSFPVKWTRIYSYTPGKMQRGHSLSSKGFKDLFLLSTTETALLTTTKRTRRKSDTGDWMTTRLEGTTLAAPHAFALGHELRTDARHNAVALVIDQYPARIGGTLSKEAGSRQPRPLFVREVATVPISLRHRLTAPLAHDTAQMEELVTDAEATSAEEDSRGRTMVEHRHGATRPVFRPAPALLTVRETVVFAPPKTHTLLRRRSVSFNT